MQKEGMMYEMKRKDREVKELSEICNILDQCTVCTISLPTDEADNQIPYVLPLSFGYEITDGKPVFYFHCAREGRKIDLIRKHGVAGFSVFPTEKIVYDKEIVCKSSCFFSSVIGTGTISVLDHVSEKCHALSVIMKQQVHDDITFSEVQANAVTILKLTAEAFSGKRKPLS